jgi:hypothetical protein
MSEEELAWSGCWYDPNYEIVDPTDDVWWLPGRLEKRLKRAYTENIISREEYDHMTEPDPRPDDGEIERCHEIMVKIGLLKRLPWQ